MTKYIVKKLLMAVLMVALVSLFVFLLMQLLPGDPARIALGEAASAEALEEYRDRYGLNDPIMVQYFNWISGIVTRWDFGKSVLNNRDVTTYITERLPNTLAIGFPSLVVGVLLGLLVGILTAIKRGTWVDQSLTFIVNFFLGTPRFLVAIFGVLVLGLQLKLIPIQGYTAPWVDFGDYLYKALWPVLVNAIYVTALLARQTRSNMLEVVNQDYVRTARANGLGEGKVIFRHTLKNALIPVITIIGLQMRNVVSGVVVIENIFNIPGIGQLLLMGIQQRDYFIVQACVLIISMVTVLANLIVDIAYGFVDPRVRKSMG